MVGKLGLTAYDSNDPNDKAYANVTITVNHNPNAPSFTTPSYNKTIKESYPLAVSLLQISGQDADQNTPFSTISYCIIGDESAHSFFRIDSQFAEISTIELSLFSDQGTVYQQLMEVFLPRVSPEATRTVNVIRNQFPPEILNLPTAVNISENQDVNQEISRVTGRDNDTSAPFNT